MPWWGAVCSAAAPVLLAAGSTIGGHLQPRPYNAMTSTVSALAALGAADRWVMTLAFAAAGACEIVTGLALRPAALAGRLILVTGGAAGLLVAASPEPAGGGGSLRHALTAAAGLAAMAAWPTAARQRGPSVPWGLRPRVSAAASALLFSVLLWFGAELIADGALEGLAERVLGGTLTLWPLLVVLSCRRGQARATASPQGTLSRTSRSLRLGDARSPRRGRGSLLRQKLRHRLGTAEPVREDSDVPSQRPRSPGRHVVRVGAAA